MEGKDKIKDLFNEKLSGFEANVRPDLWTNISSQIGAPVATTAGTGISLITKAIIGVSVAATVCVIGVYLFTRPNNQNQVKEPVESSNKENSLKTRTDHTLEKKEQQTPFSKQSFSNNKENNRVEQLNDKQNEPLNNTSLVESIKNDFAIVVPVNVANTSKEDNKTTVVVNKSDLVHDDKISEPTNAKIPEVGVVETGKDELVSVGDLPNIFTPNGDGNNDYLCVKTNNVTDFSVVVLDQNNKIVYQSTDPEFSWNGTEMSGEQVVNGRFVYYISARDSKGELITKHSVLIITR